MPAAQLTMSSSVRAPSSTQQVSKVLKQSNSSDKYHQTVYDDGRGRCIVESRQRSRGLRDADTKEFGRSPRWSVLESIEAVPWKPLSTGDPCRSSKKVPSGQNESLASSRDSVTKSSIGRSETVIIFPASSKPINAQKGSTVANSVGQAELTPPPTPRMGRLPTPELSDLDEAPFCECDDIALMVYCTSCKKEACPYAC